MLQPASLKDPAVLAQLTALQRRPRRRRRLRQDPPDGRARHPTPRHDQRPRVAAAEVPWRGADSSRGRRRRTGDRRHDHARRPGARCRADARDGPPPDRPATKPVPMSNTVSRELRRALCSSRPSTACRRTGPRKSAGRPARDLRASIDQGRRHHRLVAVRADGSRPDSRHASVAECLYVSEWPAADSAEILSRRSEPYATAPGTMLARPRRGSAWWRQDRVRFCVRELQSRGQTTDGGPRLPVRPPLSRRRPLHERHHDCAGPVAAYKMPQGGVVGPRGSSAAIEQARADSDRRARSCAGHRDCDRASAGGRLLDHLIASASRRRRRAARSGGRRRFCGSARINCSTSRACRPPRSSTMPWIWRGGRARRAPAASSTPCCAPSRGHRRALPLPPRPRRPTDRDAGTGLPYLSVSLSHPRWLVERWLDRFGFDATEQWLLFNNAPGPLALRANTIRVTQAMYCTRGWLHAESMSRPGDTRLMRCCWTAATGGR